MKYLLTAASMLTLMLAMPAAAMTEAQLRLHLSQALPSLAVQIDQIAASPVEGFFEVSLNNGSVLQVKESGDFFFYGDLYQIDGTKLVNRTETNRNDRRKLILASLDEKDMVIFAPRSGDTKGTVTVFTDVDCGFCRKLHQEVPALNKMGIAVRYLAFPRQGVTPPYSNTYRKLVSTWCADNRQLALTMVKAGKDIEEKSCENPVDQQYALGNLMGVTGTPAILYEDGRLLPGYADATELAARLGLDEPAAAVN